MITTAKYRQLSRQVMVVMVVGRQVQVVGRQIMVVGLQVMVVNRKALDGMQVMVNNCGQSV